MTQRTIIITAIAVLITCGMLSAQENAAYAPLSAKKMAAVKQNIINGLRSGNPGVMSSSMRLATEMRKRYPNEEMRKVISELRKVQETSLEGVLRYKAYLAITMCEVPGWFADMTVSGSMDDEHFFQLASTEMQKQLFVAQTAM